MSQKVSIGLQKVLISLRRFQKVAEGFQRLQKFQKVPNGPIRLLKVPTCHKKATDMSKKVPLWFFKYKQICYKKVDLY